MAFKNKHGDFDLKMFDFHSIKIFKNPMYICIFEATFLLFWNKILSDTSHLSPRETFLRQSIHIYQWIWLLKNCSYLAKQRTLLLLLMLHYISLDGASCSTKKITHNCGNKRCYMYNKSLSAAASACNSRCRNAI